MKATSGRGKPPPYEGPYYCANCGKAEMRISIVSRNFNNGLSACCADNVYPWLPFVPEKLKDRILSVLAGRITDEGHPLPMVLEARGS
jgi:hypothetical protein